MSNPDIQSYINQLQNVYSGEAWYGKCVREILDDVASEIAFKEPAPDSHSIAALLSHMLYWRELVIARLNGDVNFAVDQDQSFQWRTLLPDGEENWEALKTRFHDSHERMIAALQAREESFLENIVAARSYNFHVLLAGIVQHDIYHAGQIAYAEKLLTAHH